ncbi:MAG TPA: hypothetical protein VN377_05985 [Candidatus Thermoplasmatota archaeon]|nr:hypothetical protein [Candidatus Thermoplasmatota archaeon]
MNKKIISLSILSVAIILLTGCTPALASPENKSLAMKTDLVTIEVNHYLGRETKQIRTTVTASDAEQIRIYLTELYKAQERNDIAAIATYEALLNEKGIFGEQFHRFSSNINGIASIGKTKLSNYFPNIAGENISNSLCFFNAIGEGGMLWWIGLTFIKNLVDAITNVSNPIGAVILLIILLPLIVLTMLLTDLIPFRIFAPTGIISLRNGTVSALGANGRQKVIVGAESYGVNLSGFTGITINIPPINNHKSFLFVSGFALKAEGQPV